MRFNIKNWQDKHLIKESKLKEIDFKDKAAFDKYQSKHNMRATTKVNVAGKDTTAGEAGGGEKKQAQGKSVTAPVNGKSLSDKINKSLADFDGEDYEEEAMEQLDQLLQDTGAYDKEELTFEDGMKAIQDLDNYQDGDGMYNDEDEAYDAKIEMQDQLIDLFDEPEGGWTNDNRGNVKADGSSHDYDELDMSTKSDMHGRFDDDDDDDGDDGDGDDDGDDDYDDDEDSGRYRRSSAEDKLLNGLEAYRDGLIDKDEWDDLRDEYDEDDEYSDEDGYGPESLYKKEPQEYTTDGNFSNPKDHTLKNGEINYKDAYGKESKYPVVKKSKRNEAGVYLDLGRKVQNSPTYDRNAMEAHFQDLRLTGLSYESAKGDLEKTDSSNMKVGASVNAKPDEFKNQLFKHLEDVYAGKKTVKSTASKKESVTPRSTRIQEAKIYRTIQELKVLERGL